MNGQTKLTALDYYSYRVHSRDQRDSPEDIMQDVLLNGGK
jgi:hypothetical protein